MSLSQCIAVTPLRSMTFYLSFVLLLFFSSIVKGNEHLSLNGTENPYDCEGVKGVEKGTFSFALPGAAGPIRMSTTPCMDPEAGLVSITFSVDPITNAVDYVWTIKEGRFLSFEGNGTREFTVEFYPDNTSIRLNVRGWNSEGYGTGSDLDVPIYAPAPTPGTITGPTEVAPGQTGVSYQAPSMEGVSLYLWNLPDGASFATGWGTRFISVDYSDTFTGGEISIAGHVGPCGTGPASGIAVSIPGSRASNENYIQTLTPKEAFSPSRVMNNMDDPTKVANTIQYFDGLGRPMQVVNRAVTSAKKDLVSPVVYDNFGRQKKEYLPYVPDVGDFGSFRSSATTAAEEYYQVVKGDRIAYAEKEFEPSSLNRVLKQAAPGADWNLGSGNEVNFEYLTNTTDENVRLWTISNEKPVSLKAYDANQLYLSSFTDEDEHKVLEYKNKLGQVVLKKIEAPLKEDEVRTEAHSGWASTYFVYDDFGNLRFVIPPQAVEEMDDANNWSKAASEVTFFNEFLFAYQYDGRKRMIEKKIPGADWVYMVYDERDRLVLMNDGSQVELATEDDGVETVSGSLSVNSFQNKSYLITSTGRVTLKPGFEVSAAASGEFYISKADRVSVWQFTKFDELNRPVMTGLVELSGTRAQVQALQNNFGTKSERYTGNGALEGFTNEAFPKSGISSTNLLTVTYYDHYNFPYASSNNFEDNMMLGQTAASQNAQVRGQITGGKVKVLDGNNNWLNSVTYYDAKFRPILSITDHHLAGKDIVAHRYHFDGRVNASDRMHKKGGTNTLISDSYRYDYGGRLIRIGNTINIIGGETSYNYIENSYNEIGELTQKNLANGTAQTVDYMYNIRGWLTKINDGTDLDGRDKFGMELLYNQASEQEVISNFSPVFNGNISAMIWRRDGDGTNGQAYTYTYDEMSRLTNADYHQKSGGSWSNSNKYQVKINEYDLNGNIRKLERKGIADGADRTIDNLSYNYLNGDMSNRLAAVTDTGDNFFGFQDGTNPGNDYAYDGKGNLTVDRNKGISEISYNHLNLPERITFTTGKYIQYTYDATGRKLRKKVNDGYTNPETDYVNGIQYENGTLQFITTAEGRWKPNGVGHEFDLKDHLGNVRVTINSSGAELQGNDYYPFGMFFNHPDVDLSKNKHLYNGKEFQNDLGLEWYDYGWRNYDPAVGRWFSVDPLANNYLSLSPYNYVNNNPIRNIDPNGMFFKEYDDEEAYRAENPNGKLDGSDGHWLKSDRKNQTEVWQKANSVNLQKTDGYKEYTTITQRTAFYGWFSAEIDKEGYETNWPGAAYIVAGQMSNLDDPVVAWWVGDEVVKFGNAGNKAIFDDVFNKLTDLYNGPALKGEKAMNWDNATLQNEQFNVVQPIYERQSAATISTLTKMAKGHGWFQGSPTPYNLGVTGALRFEGNIMNPQDRFNHGAGKVTNFFKLQMTYWKLGW